MLSPEQVKHYRVFGFVMLRQYLSSEETAKHHERRLDWIRKLNELSAMPDGQGDVKAIAENGKWKIVPY